MTRRDLSDSDPQIRAARADDVEALAPLVAELGYPTSGRELSPRVERLIATPSSGILLAEARDKVIGFASFHVVDLIYRPRPQARLTAIAVHPSHRRRGIGQALVRAVEDAARDRGCFRIEVTTRRDRPAAHAFYRALGYQERPVRFVNALDR